MDNKLLFVIALTAHGIGHVIGLMTFLDLWGMSVRSSILESMGLNQGLIKVLNFIWVIPFIAFIASAWGVWTGVAWWETTGWIGTVISVLYFVVYWNSFPLNIPIQANIGNIVALLGLLGIIKIA
ncbi:hypothetical protein ACFL0D_03765 [Thermoproteota archaeon]